MSSKQCHYFALGVVASVNVHHSLMNSHASKTNRTAQTTLVWCFSFMDILPVGVLGHQSQGSMLRLLWKLKSLTTKTNHSFEDLGMDPFLKYYGPVLNRLQYLNLRLTAYRHFFVFLFFFYIGSIM